MSHQSRHDLLRLTCQDDSTISNLQPCILAGLCGSFCDSVKGVMKLQQLKDELTGVSSTPVLYSCSDADLIEVGDAVARALVLARPRHPHSVVVGLQTVITPPHQCIANVDCMEGTKSLPAWCQLALCMVTSNVFFSADHMGCDRM